MSRHPYRDQGAHCRPLDPREPSCLFTQAERTDDAGRRRYWLEETDSNVSLIGKMFRIGVDFPHGFIVNQAHLTGAARKTYTSRGTGIAAPVRCSVGSAR